MPNFLNPISQPLKGTFYGGVSGDFNNDGYIDVVYSIIQSNGVAIFLGKNGGGFNSSILSFSSIIDIRSLESSDLNRDGFLDLIGPDLTTGNIYFFKGLGNGLFATPISLGVVANVNMMVLADLDKNGTTDIAVTTSYNNSVTILYTNTSGSIVSTKNIASGGLWDRGIDSADFNGDGYLDLVVTNVNNNVASVLYGPSFTTSTLLTTDIYPIGVVAGDFNNDGLKDFATSNYNPNSNSISVFLNSKTGFKRTDIKLIGYPGERITAKDFNGDGYLDFAVSIVGSGLSILYNNGTGQSFTTEFYSAPNIGQALNLFFDQNKDGDLDLITSMQDGIYIFENNSLTKTYELPTIAVSSNVLILNAGDVATLTFSLSKPSTNFTASDITVSGGTLSNFTGSGTTYTAFFIPNSNSLINGVLSVASGVFTDVSSYANADGADGNNTVTFAIDSVIPTIAVSSSKSNLIAGDSATLTFTLSEPSTNFIASDITVSGGTLSNFTGSGTSYTALFTPTANSVINGVVRVASGVITDAAGNANADGADANNTVTFAIDSIIPTIAVSSSKSNLIAGDSATLIFTLSEPSTNFIASDITFSGGTLSNFTGSGTSYTALFTPTANSVINGVVRVASGVFTDAAGNPNADGSDANNTFTFTINTLPIVKNIVGTPGNDSYVASSGTYAFDGGTGIDTVVWSQPSISYQLSPTTTGWQVTNKTGLDGSSSLVNIERLSFTDRTVILDSQAHASYAGLPTELYQFFITAFNAAPGVTYMDQLADAYRYGLSVKQIVDIFTTKSQFTNVYPTTLSNLDMATQLVNNIVKTSATNAVKASAVADIKAAMDGGWTVGQVIYQVFGNLAKMPLTDPSWGNTTKQFNNEIAVAKYYTEVLNQSTTDLKTLMDVIQSVTQSTNVSTDAVVAQLIGDALLTGTSPPPPTYSLAPNTASADEGSTATFTLTTTNVAPGTSVRFALSGSISALDVSGGVMSGNTTVNASGVATISVSLLNDSLVEGPETLTVTAGGATASILVNDKTPSYVLKAGGTSVNEGSTATFTLTTTNVASGTSVPYTISGISAADVFGGVLSGYAVVNSSGTAIISLALLNDLLTEGPETLTVTASGATASTVVNDTSTSALTYTLSAGGTSFNEGSTATFTLTTTNVASGTSVPYTISGISAADVFGGVLSGNAVVNSSGTAIISVALLNDLLTEGPEALTVTAGGATASTVVNDVSTSAPTYTLNAGGTSFNEGSTISLNVRTTDLKAGSVLNYTFTGSGIDSKDFADGKLNGAVTIDSFGNGLILIPVKNDETTEGNEILHISLLNTNAYIDINILDTSVTLIANPPSPPSDSFA